MTRSSPTIEVGISGAFPTLKNVNLSDHQEEKVAVCAPSGGSTLSHLLDMLARRTSRTDCQGPS